MVRGSDRSAKLYTEIFNLKDATIEKLNQNWTRAEVEFAKNVVMLSDLIS